MKKILGIDPALNKLGWGVIAITPKPLYIACGSITTKPKMPLPLRLSSLVTAITEIMDTHLPDVIAMEESFVNINPGSSLKLAYVRGAIMALVGQRGTDFFEYKPNLIKKTVVGTGHAEKEQILHMIKIILSAAGEQISSYDAADALAVAYTCSVIK